MPSGRTCGRAVSLFLSLPDRRRGSCMLTFRCAADIICVKRATLIIGAESESPYFAVGRTADCVFETETDEDVSFILLASVALALAISHIYVAKIYLWGYMLLNSHVPVS